MYASFFFILIAGMRTRKISIGRSQKLKRRKKKLERRKNFPKRRFRKMNRRFSVAKRPYVFTVCLSDMSERVQKGGKIPVFGFFRTFAVCITNNEVYEFENRSVGKASA